MVKRKAFLRKGILLRGALYVLLVFILAVATNLPLLPQATLEAYAAEGGEGASGEEPPPTIPQVMDVGIYLTGSGNGLGYASNSSDEIRGTITAKGGTLDFYNIITWTNWTKTTDSYLVTWSVNNPAIASIDSTGLLTARADGLVQVKATVLGEETASGSDLVAYTYIEIVGQSDARYVESITIINETGAPLGDVYEWEPALATDLMQFYAQVSVCDPKTGVRETYSTLNGSLSSQAPDLSDLLWVVSDTNMGSIDENTGQFRARTHGGVAVYATSNAGISSFLVVAAILVISNPPEGYDPEGFNPQSSLTIKAYYEEYTPSEYGDEAYVINKTYSVEDMESLGTVTQTYTALGGRYGYSTYTGRGVPFATLLSNAEVDLDKTIRLNIRAYDGVFVVMKEEIFDYNRYYYPNIDIGSYAGAVQVYPIIALESNHRQGGSVQPDYNMTIGTRFRLLFGGNPSLGEGYSSSRYSINQIEVVFEGAPPSKPVPGDPGGDGSGEGSGSDDGTGTGQDGMGTSSGAMGNTPGTAGFGDDAEGAMALGQADVGLSLLDEPGTPAAVSGNYSVYSMMSKHSTEDEEQLEISNPIKPFALPIGAAVFFAGGIEMLLWYRRQTQQAVLMLNQGA